MKKIINNAADANLIWKGLGGHFDSFTQILNEFIDNSISNLKSNKGLSFKQIQIQITELEDKLKVEIEDSGTGFKNLDSAFTLGSQEAKDSTMNEHGYGFKHALATVDPENNSWLIATRTIEEQKRGVYNKISAPYRVQDFYCEEVSESMDSWPGAYSGSGTFFRFSCTKELFNTVVSGIKGNHSFKSKMNYLAEDIGFCYSALIKEGLAPIALIGVSFSGEQIYNKAVPSILPEIENVISIGTGKTPVKLDGEIVDVAYEFLDIKEHSSAKKYYQKTMSTSGVEIRINGRLISYNLFKEVWGIEKHNCYNYLLVKLDLISDNHNCLPVTRTSKNGIKKGDKKLEDLFEWVRGHLSKPDQSNKSYEDQDELTLFQQLKELKVKQLPGPKTISTEQKVFSTIGWAVRVDLWQFFNNTLTIYEGKKGKTSPQDVYQLRMYWDGCIVDGNNPKAGVLIGVSHPESVEQLIDIINKMKDVNGNYYAFTLKTWRDEGINFG